MGDRVNLQYKCYTFLCRIVPSNNFSPDLWYDMTPYPALHNICDPFIEVMLYFLWIYHCIVSIFGRERGIISHFTVALLREILTRERERERERIKLVLKYGHIYSGFAAMTSCFDTQPKKWHCHSYVCGFVTKDFSLRDDLNKKKRQKERKRLRQINPI